MQRIVRVRPDLRDVEAVPAICLRILPRHDLNADAPGWEIAFRDGVAQIAGGMVRVLAGHARGLFAREVLDALVGLEVELHPAVRAARVVPLERMAAVAVHVAVASRRAAVGEEDRDLVDGLRRERQEIPEHVRVRRVGRRVALLGMDEVGELQRIADEEDRRVVAGHVVIALFGVELDREAARVARGVGGALFAADSGEPGEHFGLLARPREELGARVLRHVGGALELAVGAGALGVHDALGDALAVEVRQLLHQVHVPRQDRPARPCGQRVLIVIHTRPGGERQLLRFVGHGLAPCRKVSRPVPLPPFESPSRAPRDENRPTPESYTAELGKSIPFCRVI